MFSVPFDLQSRSAKEIRLTASQIAVDPSDTKGEETAAVGQPNNGFDLGEVAPPGNEENNSA